ncbi:caspase family protein, partial [Klebsiella aerogenes]|uniref:caspase family protein n=1 Tax=Klebsiella aerogenes TaxID=548 RepID=UPI0037A2B180
MTGSFYLRRTAAVAAALIVLLCVTGANPALADKRVALVIGNSAYKSVTPLPNPAKDAAAIGAMLIKAGFEVIDAREDLPVADMKRM